MGREFDAQAYHELWQEVVLRAAEDATAEKTTINSGSGISRADKFRTQSWFGSKDFFTVCALAGWDGDFILEAYRDGRLNQARIRAAIKSRSQPQERVEA